MKENNKKLRNKILSAVSTAMLVVTGCFCAFVAVQVIANGYVSVAGYSFFRVVTPSMEPTLCVNEIIITDAVPMEQVKADDIVSFRSQSADMFGTIITHRVMEIHTDENGETCFLTKGDANLSVDGRYVVKSNFVGKMVWSSGDSILSSVFTFISSKQGFIACVVLPCLLLLILVLKSSVKNINKNIGQLIDALDKQEKLKEVNPENSEEYDEMYERIRKELIEELTASENTQETKIE